MSQATPLAGKLKLAVGYSGTYAFTTFLNRFFRVSRRLSSIVGLPEKAVQESRERVRAAIANSQFEFPSQRVLVNSTHIRLPRESGGFDLPIAIGILVASGQVSGNNIDDYEFIGELALSGKIRPARGMLPVAIGCEQAGKQLIFPTGNQHEVSLLTNFAAYPCESFTCSNSPP